MVKRYGRTLIDVRLAKHRSYEARNRGSDHADKAGDCLDPVMVAMTGLRDSRLHTHSEITRVLADDPFTDYAPGVGWIDCYGRRADAPVIGPNVPVHVDLAVRCRKCANCLKQRSRMWAARARQELALVERSWFGTLTVAPESLYSVVSRARYNSRASGVDFDRAPSDYRFGAKHKVISADLTKYLKRIRKESGAQLRYLLVAEAHKSGEPHYHALIHEARGVVRERTLSGQWQLGFCQWRLVGDNGAASYVAKYLAKSAQARVRASVNYGRSVDHSAKTLIGGGVGNPRFPGKSMF